jgi:hypothetical protein
MVDGAIFSSCTSRPIDKRLQHIHHWWSLSREQATINQDQMLLMAQSLLVVSISFHLN